MDSYVRLSIAVFFARPDELHRWNTVSELIDMMTDEGRRATLKQLMRDATAKDGQQKNKTGRTGNLLLEMTDALGPCNKAFREQTKYIETL